jgi:hypothetical protein
LHLLFLNIAFIPNAVFIVFDSPRSVLILSSSKPSQRWDLMKATYIWDRKALGILASRVVSIVPQRALCQAIQTSEFPILRGVLQRQHLLAIGEMSRLQSERT